MTFKQAVGKTKHLEKAYCEGLQALEDKCKKHIQAEDTRKITGSVFVDKAYVKIDPYGNRWDYGIAYQHTNRKDEFIYWVETHTASDSQVGKVILKAKWLRNWLKNEGKLLAVFECEILWVSSGATTFTLSAPQKKMMAQVGLKELPLKAAGGRLRILHQRKD